MQAHLARVGSVAAIAGALVLTITTWVHPLGADPNDAEEAFAEYAPPIHCGSRVISGSLSPSRC